MLNINLNFKQKSTKEKYNPIIEKDSIFKPIKGFENMYEISNYGIIKSVDRNIICKDGQIKPIKSRYIRPADNGSGYKFVYLWKDNKQHRYYVHRLVAETFIPNPENKPTVNHKDGNRYNNCVDNLEWATYSENIQHAFNTGLNKSTLGWKNPKANRWRPVEKCNLNGEVICKFDTIQDAADDLQVPDKYIYKVCRGEISNTKGFKYRYCDHE